MSGRRAATNRIRGPQSALTDFLASNNISAAQIQADYERRQREAQQQQEQEAVANGDTNARDEEAEERVETAVQKKKRKRQQERTLAKIREGKDSKRGKRGKGGGSDEEDDENEVLWDMYSKKRPLPGQLENCELCGKRFTVTPYSKTGPDGGLLCVKCSKEQEAERKKDEKVKKQAGSREKRRQIQSDLLDGKVHVGSKSLQELCIKEVANNIHDVDEFGDLPPSLLNRLSQILSKRRVLTSRTLDLFLRPDVEAINLYDCGKLETEDYVRIFSVVPKVTSLNLRHAGQFKDEVLDYVMEREIPINNLQLEAANLVSNEKWIEFFTQCGSRLQSLKLSWLDYSMDDDALMHLVRGCPNLKRLKLKKCFKLGDDAIAALEALEKLEHLSLEFSLSTSATALMHLISSIGPNLRTLSLDGFTDADDQVLSTIQASCSKLTKLRFRENDVCTDAGFVSLFSNWSNPPLSYIDLSSTRSIDYTEPNGPEDPIGLASAGFEAMMEHSGSTLTSLNIKSCRHISHEAFSEVFCGKTLYPLLKDVDLSFCTTVDTTIIAGLFRSCPQLARVTAFCCFNITDIAVPKGVALIGVPHAQESIVQEGDIDVDRLLAGGMGGL